MSIVVNEKNKKRILKYISDNALENDFNSKFIQIALQNLKDNNELDENVARKVLEEIYQSGKIIRDIVTPDKEFEERFTTVFKNYDDLPKPDNYGSFETTLSEEDILHSIESCFELTELSDEFNNVRDARKIAQEAINSIDFLQKNNIKVQEEIENKLEEINSNLQNLLKKDKTDLSSMQNQIDQYNKNAMQIWNDYLSDPLQENSEGKYLIHNFTSGHIKGEFRDKYMSTSLITDNAMGIYGSSGFGMIIKPKHIVAADSKDIYTINNSNNENRVTNIKHPIKLPQQIEAEMIEICKNVNGEILNSDKESIYSEVIVDEYEVAGIFLITNGEKGLNPHYLEAIELANEKGVPFKDRDITKKRKEKGLNPLSTEMKKQLCRKILYTYSYKEKYGIANENYEKFASEFIKKHYENFADRFMAVKGQEGYTAEDIEKEFRKMILNDAVHAKDGIQIFDRESISHYHSFFLGKVTEAEFKYIVSNRYDFSKCETLEEFKERYLEFKDRVVQSKYFDEAQEYLDEMFVGNEALVGKDLSDEELERLFNLEDRSLSSIVNYVQDRDKETIKKSGLINEEISVNDKVIAAVNKEKAIESEMDEEGVCINEFGEIVRNKNEQGAILEAPELNIQVSSPNVQLTFMQRIAKRVSSSKFLSKLSFIKKFTQKQLKMLPDSKKEFKTVENVDNKSNKFMKSLQNLRKDEKEIVTSIDEQSKVKEIPKRLEEKSGDEVQV